MASVRYTVNVARGQSLVDFLLISKSGSFFSPPPLILYHKTDQLIY